MSKLVLISFSMSVGGAAIAARKFYEIGLGLPGFSVTTVTPPMTAGHLAKRVIAYILGQLQYDRNPIKHSLNLFSSKLVVRALKESCSAAVYHLHWVNNDTLSISDFRYIPSGSIVTLHDEWLYCGAEHYHYFKSEKYKFIEGCRFFDRDVLGLNWNYIIWKRKLKILERRKDIIYTVPSSWMLERAQQSAILAGANIRLLPNPIDTTVFRRAEASDRKRFRNELGLEDEDIVLCFGAVSVKNNVYKGGHLLLEALQEMVRLESGQSNKKIKLLVFGGKTAGKSMVSGLERTDVGHISEQNKLSLIYSCSDIVVVPSLVESFGQVAAEALACETPVVSFDTSGLRDIVIEGVTGLCARSFCTSSLARRLHEFIMMPRDERKAFGVRGRAHVEKNFSYPVIADKYRQVIEKAQEIKSAL